ncbi:unnamed protein product [Diplocarpon coronariae]|uniref:Uncharacterized protein n=1 Tax=Diplocarpon coronariae TaxID=2795749 RepID=A0A218YTV9_9HELO|nr:hypothetical protein B2J93_8271 [Marssonina coronariae]
MVKKLGVVCALLALASVSFAAPPPKRLVRHRKVKGSSWRPFPIDESYERVAEPSSVYPEYSMVVPVDHFHNDTRYEPHTNDEFFIRYWFDASYYQDGGPVFVLQSGSTSGQDQLNYLQKGILHDLAVATNGIAVVLEHRYYGESFPVPDLSKESLRFLTTDQAMADQAYFAKNVVFAGLEGKNLKAPNTAYIALGGGYAGSLVALSRKLYPDVFWGAIATSAVTYATQDNWAYWEPIRTYADQKCMAHHQKITKIVDNILLGKKDPATTAKLKRAFGLQGLTHDDDFAYIISVALLTWENQSWDEMESDPTFKQYCSHLTSPHVVYQETHALSNIVQDLIKVGGYEAEVASLTTPWLNWTGYIAKYVLSRCTKSQDACFSLHERPFYKYDDIRQDWRTWPYQLCTQWGLWQTGSGTPEHLLPMVSRTIDFKYLSQICRYAFNIDAPPDVNAINKHGGFNLSHHRLAFIEGEQSPWRPSGPHASPFIPTAVNRTNTAGEPFMLINGAIHAWDLDGVLPHRRVDYPPNFLPPIPVRETQYQEVMIVQQWLQEWQLELLIRNQKREEHEADVRT